MDDDLTIKLGDFQVIPLEREYFGRPPKMAYVRYQGMPNTNVFVLEIGVYEAELREQKPTCPTFFPADIKTIEFRVDTYGRKVVLFKQKVDPFQIVVGNMTPTPTAVDDRVSARARRA